MITSFCKEQLERIEAGKMPIYTVEICEKVLQILDFILKNTEELLERELSILLLADSKAFEKNIEIKSAKCFALIWTFLKK